MNKTALIVGYGAIALAAIVVILVIVLVIKAICARVRKSADSAVAEPAPAPQPEPQVPAPTAPGSAGQLKLHDVEPRTAAMLMAIVADKMGKPLNELRFISIKEVK